MPSTSANPQSHDDAGHFPAGAKEKDWSININTGHTATEQGKSKPPPTGLAMDDNMSNKRKLHFVYPAGRCDIIIWTICCHCNANTLDWSNSNANTATFVSILTKCFNGLEVTTPLNQYFFLEKILTFSFNVYC